jgi:hypothetical protein
VHGVIDGFSRLVCSLRAASNNKAATVAQFFLDATAAIGWPARMRGDKGGENYGVVRLMLEHHGIESKAFIAGRSVHNQRIERLWADVNPRVLHLFWELFHQMEEQQVLDINSDLHLLALHIVTGFSFLSLLQVDYVFTARICSLIVCVCVCVCVFASIYLSYRCTCRR